MFAGHRARWHRRRAVDSVIAAILMVAITVVVAVLIWLIRVPTPPQPPQVSYQARGGTTFPVWGDPTDCRPNLPYPWSYYLGNGTRDPRWNTYMNAWWNDCEYTTNGIYNQMNVSQITITQVSQAISLANVQFDFVCHNDTPVPITTHLVRGSLQAMSWIPGSSQILPSNAPQLGSCATFNASGYGGGAFGVYYNRLGFFEPVAMGSTVLRPGDTFILYLHTPYSVLEAPSPIEPRSYWNLPDVDDYHGAPPWCFTTPGACTIYLTDTAWSTPLVLATIPVALL